MTLKEIVKDWLVQNGYDGLVCPEMECGCENEDLICCDMPDFYECVAGHREVVDPADNEFGADWLMYPGRKGEKSENIE